MRIGMQMWGSQGDIRTFIALANALHSAGHDVTLCIPRVDSVSIYRPSMLREYE
jgi:sterol 3beta-glucosyltransferase